MFEVPTDLLVDDFIHVGPYLLAVLIQLFRMERSSKPIKTDTVGNTTKGLLDDHEDANGILNKVDV